MEEQSNTRFYRHQHHQMVELTHAHDPNMCTTAARFSDTQHESLLNYSKNNVLLHEAAESCKTVDELPASTGVETMFHSQRQLDQQQHVMLPVIGFHQRSSNCNTFQNYYVQPQQSTMFSASPEVECLNTFQIGTQCSFQHDSHAQTNENSVELMAQFAQLHNLANVANNNDCNNDSREQERPLFLQSSMSPLLAAVNDITKRDAELQLHLSQNETSPTRSMLIPAARYSNHFTTDLCSDNESECCMIADQPVYSRAKASLPTKYLQFGELDPITSEPSIYSKKCIPERTKFGPLEGDILNVSEIDLDVLHVQSPRYFPLLMLDETHVLDISNENSSNWMRYIRLAETYAQQNLHLILEHGKIYFKTIRKILAKEELRVGYQRSYAAHFLLHFLQPTENDFSQEENVPMVRQKRQCVKFKYKEVIAKQSSKRKLTKKCSRRKQSNKKNNIVDDNDNVKHLDKNQSKAYKCNLCAKRFRTQQRLESHTTTHADNLTKPHTCTICQQKCATPAALNAHIQSHSNSLYTCVYCQQNFKYVRDFKTHVTTHQLNGTFKCTHCNKNYLAYHLVRKHVRIFHTKRELNCDLCEKKFQNHNSLQRHKRTHAPKKHQVCPECKRSFLRKDQLVAHLKRIHNKIQENISIDLTTYSSECASTQSTHDIKSNDNSETDKASQQLDENLKSNALEIANNVSNIPDPNIDTSVGKDVELCAKKSLPSVFTSSSSNRRKQTPTKLKTIELNSETFVTLSEMLTPFFISEQDLHEEFKKPEYLNVNQIFGERIENRERTDVEQNKAKANFTIENVDILKTDSNINKIAPSLQTESVTSSKEQSLDEVTNVNACREQSRTISENISNGLNTIQNDDYNKCLNPENNNQIHVNLTYTSSNAVLSQMDCNSMMMQNDDFNRCLNSNNNSQTHDNLSQKSLNAAPNQIDCSSAYPFKCHLCTNANSFKRRGILVNHFNKMHPQVNLNEIEILNTPIIKPQLIFPCNYCANIYKSNAKRKAHILKHHPGNELPASLRCNNTSESKVEMVGCIEANAHKCQHCPRQYAARSRLVSHYRKWHPDIKVPTIDITKAVIHTAIQEQNVSDQLLFVEPEYIPAAASPENKLLKLSSAALEFSRFDFLNERCNVSDDLNHLPALFEETPPLASFGDVDGLDKYNNRSIEVKFFEKIGKI